MVNATMAEYTPWASASIGHNFLFIFLEEEGIQTWLPLQWELAMASVLRSHLL